MESSLTAAIWRTATASAGGNCVQVAVVAGRQS
jgi:hypothetical protein